MKTKALPLVRERGTGVGWGGVVGIVWRGVSMGERSGCSEINYNSQDSLVGAPGSCSLFYTPGPSPHARAVPLPAPFFEQLLLWASSRISTLRGRLMGIFLAFLFSRCHFSRLVFSVISLLRMPKDWSSVKTELEPGIK